MADEINLELKVDTSGAKKALKDFEGTAGSSIDSISSAFSALKGVAAAAVAALAVREVIQFFTEAASASAKGEEQISKLAASLKSVGDFSPQAVQSFKDFANQLQSTSKFSDDAVIAQVAYVKQLGLTDAQTKKLIQASADLASVNSISLETAISQLTNTLKGNERSLQEVGVQQGKYTKEQLKSGAAVDEVAKRVNGLAKESINNYSGAMIQLGNAHQDFQKAVGSIITQNPAFVAMIQGLKKGFEVLEQFVIENKEAFIEFGTVLIKGFVGAVSLAIDASIAFAKALKMASNIATPIVSLVIDVVKAFLGFEIVQKVINAWSQTFQDAVQVIFMSIKGLLLIMEQIPGASSVLETMGVNIQETIKDIDNATSALDEMREEGFDFKKPLQNLEDLQVGIAGFHDKTDNALGMTIDVMEKMSGVTDEVSKAIIKSNSGMSESAKKLAADKLAADQKQVKSQRELDKALAVSGTEHAKLVEDAKKFLESYFQKERNTVDGVIAERDRNLASLDKFIKADIPEITAQGEHLRQVIIAESEQKIKDIRQKALDQFKKNVSEAAASPLRVFVDEIDFDPAALKGMEKAIGGVIGTIGSVLQGKSGAESFVKAAAGAMADAFLPGVGAAVSEIVGVLQQGPEAVKKMMDEFVAALPALVENIGRSIPVLLEGLAKVSPAIISGILDALPDIIRGLVDRLPAIIQAFSDAIPTIINKFSESMPLIIDALIEAFVVKGGAVKIGVAIVAAMWNPQTFIAMGRAVLEGFATPFKMLRLPEFKFPDLPKFTWPNLPKFEWPKLPEFKWPKIETPQWVTDLINTLKSFNPLSSATGGIGGIGGGGGGVLGGAVRVGKAVVTGGLSEVIPGFGLIEQRKTTLEEYYPRIGLSPSERQQLKDGLDSLRQTEEYKRYGQDYLQTFANLFAERVLGGNQHINISRLASGGTIPFGFPNDTFPARLSSREHVLDVGLSERLDSFLKEGGSGMSEALLMKIVALLEEPISVSTTAEVNQKAFADIFLQLNRQNARLA